MDSTRSAGTKRIPRDDLKMRSATLVFVANSAKQRELRLDDGRWLH